jgi:opacity protein-like surface antigen
MMVKKIAIMLLGTSLASGLLYAETMSEAKGFIGLEVGGANIQADRAGFYAETNYAGDYNVEYGLRIGAQNENWRTMFVFNYFDSTDDNQNYEKALVELDYFFLSSGSETTSFKPYIGINIGYMNYESDGEGLTVSIDESGFLYGGQVGFCIGLSEAIDLDVMYRYSLVDTEQTDHTESIVVGLNYMF